ncbi:hypothetical protein F4777DRAFT_557810 [Nemania sp. FL0916]|nr:hypothetical protein F4777DRAFT_557810 [Nemania sp. FL0916]
MSHLISPSLLRICASQHFSKNTRILISRRITLSAAQAAKSLGFNLQGQTHEETQVLDGNQLRKLSLTLGRRKLYQDLDVSALAPPDGTPIPPGYHLVYFTPAGPEDELGPDGSDASFNAPPPFSRRMWAGGRMSWVGGGETRLRVGDEVCEKTKLINATAKTSKSGEEMVLVEVRKEFWGPGGLAVVDDRSWIFRTPAMIESLPKLSLYDAATTGPSTVKDYPCAQIGTIPRRELRWSATGLFRFSALTFNGHKIHYDPAWTAAVEGHPACVVHGPLNLINMLDYWRDHCVDGERRIIEVHYRAVAPVYAGEIYQISATPGTPYEGSGANKNKWEVRVTRDGTKLMTGTILGNSMRSLAH